MKKQQTDTLIDIATGHSVNCRRWENVKTSWPDLVSKLTTVNRTPETYKSFLKSSKDDQLKIKDVGGLVGGYVRGGKRKIGNIMHRQLLTLDIDYADNMFWGDFLMAYDVAAVLHSTHKHSEESPRFRLVIPLSREVTPDEYVAISRKVGGVLDIDVFDPSTFQSERLMFWPSASSDGVFKYEIQEGNWLDADEVLESYVDWADSSAWPTTKAEVQKLNSLTDKQEDPELKKGMVGVFCRTFGIGEVVSEFLSDEYESGSGGRYTYLSGSTSNGLVVYEDKWAYSHHGTDPCGGKLCNSFDLVRIHKYGHLDEGQRVRGAKANSFNAMVDFCKDVEAVKRTIASETITDARYDFADPIAFEKGNSEELEIEWASELETDKSGKYLSSAHNIGVILCNDPNLKGAFRENSFEDKKYVFKSTPWRAVKSPEPFRDVDISGLRDYLDKVYNISATLKIDDSLKLAFDRNRYNPLVDYLKSLKWDGVNRIDNLLIDYFGADDNLYTREAMKVTLVGAVARAFRPGVKFDLVLTLVGTTQGTGKSTFFSKLGMQWFSDSFHTLSGTKAFEQLRGAWIMEMAELSGLAGGRVEAVKHFISKQVDVYRPAWGKIVEDFKRKLIFVATTNVKDFLKDPSGNRRFMPIDLNESKIKKNILSNTELTGEGVDQIWAEAVNLYEKGHNIYLSPEAEVIARKEQSAHTEFDDRSGVVVDYLEKLLPVDWDSLDLIDRRDFINDPLSPNGIDRRDFVCVAELWCECLGKNKSEMTRYNTRSLNDILRSLHDWEGVNTTKNFKIYGTQKYYRRK